MKGILLGCLVAVFVLGCDRNPADQVGEEMLASYDRSMEAAEEASRQAMERYIRSYRALNGRYPESLQDLQGPVSGHFDPERYAYDPRTGTLTER